MKLIKIAATAAPAILAMMVASTSWANCEGAGTFNCVSGVWHFEAAPNGCFKGNLQPSEGPAVEFALQYSLPMSLADVLNLLSKENALEDGAARSILYTGAKTSCSGEGFLINGPVRNQNFPPSP